MAVYHCCSAI